MATFENDELTRTIELSTSRNVLETIKGSHRMEIKGFSLAKGLGFGKSITSDIFTVGGYKWAICFYPDGWSKNTENDLIYVSVYIELKSNEVNVRACIKWTLVAQTGSKTNIIYGPSKNGPRTFNSMGTMWGYTKFYERDSLEAEFLHEDCLVLECTIGVVTRSMERLKNYNIAMPPSDMATSFKHLFNSQFGCDIVFKVGDEKFKAHKVILATRSPVFRAQFYGLLGNIKNDTVVIEDIQPSIFKAMLLYIYTDSLPDVNEIMGSESFSYYAIMLQHLLAAADRFGIDRLKLICEFKLCDAITLQNVPTILSLADLHGCDQLKSACLEFITSANLNADNTGKDYSIGSIFTWLINGWWKCQWRNNKREREMGCKLSGK